MHVPDPVYLPTPQDWNRWLAENHDATEVWLLFHKKATGLPSLTWEQAVIEALAHGWIDGVRKTRDATSWMQRFTPRKKGSSWSLKNVGHVEQLIAEGRMTPRGLAHVTAAQADGRWDRAYSASRGAATLPDDFMAALAGNPAAEAGLAALDSRNRFAISYRLSAVKRPETRARKVAEYVALLAGGGRLL